MTLRSRDRIALIAILVLALIGACYLLVLKPEQHKASALDAAIAKQQQTLTTAEQNFAAGRAAQASLQKQSKQWAALHLAVPEQSDIPGLLRILERNADAVGVKLQAIQLSGGSSTSSSTSSSGTGGSSTTDGATGVPVQLTFAGGYIALDKLVRRLNGMVTVSGNTIRATGPLLSISNVSLSGSSPLTVSLTASIYQLAPASTTSSTSPAGG